MAPNLPKYCFPHGTLVHTQKLVCKENVDFSGYKRERDYFIPLIGIKSTDESIIQEGLVNFVGLPSLSNLTALSFLSSQKLWRFFPGNIIHINTYNLVFPRGKPLAGNLSTKILGLFYPQIPVGFNACSKRFKCGKMHVD